MKQIPYNTKEIFLMQVKAIRMNNFCQLNFAY
jgi:hypothetical protein